MIPIMCILIDIMAVIPLLCMGINRYTIDAFTMDYEMNDAFRLTHSLVD